MPLCAFPNLNATVGLRQGCSLSAGPGGVNSPSCKPWNVLSKQPHQKGGPHLPDVAKTLMPGWVGRNIAELMGIPGHTNTVSSQRTRPVNPCPSPQQPPSSSSQVLLKKTPPPQLLLQLPVVGSGTTSLACVASLDAQRLRRASGSPGT